MALPGLHAYLMADAFDPDRGALSWLHNCGEGNVFRFMATATSKSALLAAYNVPCLSALINTDTFNLTGMFYLEAP
jgi:hypothetical protein